MKKIIDAQDSAEFFAQKKYQCRIFLKKTPVHIFLLWIYFFLICGLSKRFCAICHTLFGVNFLTLIRKVSRWVIFNLMI
jgi:hypothetical protein